MVKKGLTIFLHEGRTYMGIPDLDKDGYPEEENGFIRLVDAIQLSIRTQPDGAVGIAPHPVVPARQPTTLYLPHPCAHFLAEEDGELVALYAQMTGRSPILIPGIHR
jgi:hypothetical protein